MHRHLQLCCAVLTILLVQLPLHAEQLASQDELYTGPEYKKAFVNPKDDPNRPNVLIIGDSISIGYTARVRYLLRGKADVFRIKGNGQHSSNGLKRIDGWVKGRDYDVIHFNWGLWDLCYRHPDSKVQGHRDKVNGTLTTTLEIYQANLKGIIAKLKKTNSQLIWCDTTPVPEKEAGRIAGDALKYNAIAHKIMKANDITINPLYAHAKLKLPAIMKKEGDVHFTPEGYNHLAEQVAKAIQAALPKSK